MTSPIDLPISITYDIIKASLDNDVLLSKNTKVAFSRIGGVFILYITHLANEICKSKGRSKIIVSDIKEALEKAGFEDFNKEIQESVDNYENYLACKLNNKENINDKNKETENNTTTKEISNSIDIEK